MYYGVILNDRQSLERIGPLDGAPYKGAPKAPALYIKPANTVCAQGAAVRLPKGSPSVEVAGAIGLVMGRAAGRLTLANALEAVSEVVLVADLSLPHDSYYRPPIREKCFDGSLPVGPRAKIADIEALVVTTQVDGVEVERFALADLLRDPARLLVDVTEFMTLGAGDVLLTGVHYHAPQAGRGSRVEIHAEGVGALSFSIAEGDA